MTKRDTMNQLITPKKLMLFCDECKKVQRHKKCVFPKYYYACQVCGEQRRINKSKNGWIDTIKKRRKEEERMKKHEEIPPLHSDEGFKRWLEKMRGSPL